MSADGATCVSPVYLPWVILPLNVRPGERPQLGLSHDLCGGLGLGIARHRTGLDEVGVGAGEGGGRDVVALQPVSNSCTVRLNAV